MTGYRIGIDVGGTFTDLVARRPDGLWPPARFASLTAVLALRRRRGPL